MRPETIRTQAYVDALRARARQLSVRVRLEHGPEALWPFISNTDMINAQTSLPQIRVLPRPTGIGGSHLSVESSELGLPVRYEELPYEWQRPLWLRVERLFTQGPLSYMCFESRLEALPDGKTEATISLRLTPKLPWVLLRPRAMQVLTRMRGLYEKVDARLIRRKPLGVEAFLADPARYEAKIAALSQRWGRLAGDETMARTVASYVYTAPDRFVSKLRPFELAALYGLDPMATLSFFLKATKAGFLNLSWDLLCPGCQGAKSETGSLSKLNPNAHCDVCDIDYSASLDENFELTFQPVSTVRSFYDAAFCAGSPANTAHLAGQINLWPQQPRSLILSLSPGAYRFRCPSLQGDVAFKVSEQGLAHYELALGESFLPASGVDLCLAPDCELLLRNDRDLLQSLRIEDLGWKALRVSAALVSTLQEFRDSFSSEVLRPGVQLAVANLTVMFTDLKDSTRMYELRGDATAFSLVQEHFEIMHDLIAAGQGAIVKTIGDAVLAVFQDPCKALACALEIQRIFGERNQQHPERQIIVKLGLHQGPSIALNLNDRLDYFGSTINKAARIQSESVGEDIVISPEILAAEGIAELIGAHPLSEFAKNLKGLSGQARLYRIEPR